MIQSIIQRRGEVSFPKYAGERVYMHKFFKKNGLSNGLSHWNGTVEAMLDGIDTDGPVYLMIDQSFVKAGESQRRPGLHIDGYWQEGIGHGVGGHGAARLYGHTPFPTHVGNPNSANWEEYDFSSPEALILATDICASRGYQGYYDVAPKHGGDYSHLNTRDLSAIPIIANVVHAGNVSMLHESLPVEQDCFRTLVRLNVPGWTPPAPKHH